MKEENSLTEQKLEKIRNYTRKDLTADEIYTFPLILCDNEIDRDGEKFTVEALKTLSELFVGKTGIFDHNMSSKDQTARIYETEVLVDDTRKTADGESYTCIKAQAYMLRSEKNADLINEIDAGIKKETSIGCSVGSVKCSVCGKDMRNGSCEHIRGQVYDGKKCCRLLSEPTDAYEWSFVAVPAQKNAGVVKSFDPTREDLSKWADEFRLEMRECIIKDGARAMPGLESGVLSLVCDSLPTDVLKKFRNALRSESAKHLPLVRQLVQTEAAAKTDNNEYKI